jgi:integrase
LERVLAAHRQRGDLLQRRRLKSQHVTCPKLERNQNYRQNGEFYLFEGLGKNSQKGGKEHEMPVHHLLEQILDEYIVAAGLQSGQPLFQSVNSLGTAVTGRALNRYNAWAAIRKRAKAAGFLTPVGCHTWRATGITIYLENDGRLEHAQQMAGHESPRTTKLYDRTKDEITLSEVERIRL